MNNTSAIADLITTMLHAIDVVDWETVRDSFTDTVFVDYTSLQGGRPGELSADQLIRNWQALVPGFDATQHLGAGLIVSPDSENVHAKTNVHAWHYIKNAEGGDFWAVAGHYEFAFESISSHVKISRMSLHLFFQHGNLQLPEQAKIRADKAPRQYSIKSP